MKVEIQELEPCRKSITVEIAKEEVDKAFSSVYSELRRQVTIPGFRPGRAPLSIVKARFSEYAKAQVLEGLLKTSYEKLLEEYGLKPEVEPEFSELELEEGKPMKYKVVLEVKPEFELKDYEGIEVEKKNYIITDEFVEETIQRLREDLAEYKDKDGPAEKGDVVVVDYELFDGDTPIEDSRLEGAVVHLGSGDSIKEFEDALYGKKRGDEFEAEVTFPEDHPDKRVAGKTVVFRGKVVAVKEKVLPELDEEFFKKYGVEDLDGLRKQVREGLEKRFKELSRTEVMNELAEKIGEQYDFPVPPSLVNKEVEKELGKYEMDLRMKGIEPREEELERKKEEIRERVIKRYRTAYVLEKIAEKEGIEVSRSDVEARLERISERTNLPMEYVADFYTRGGFMGSLVGNILIDKTLEHLLGKAKIIEKEVELPLKEEGGQ